MKNRQVLYDNLLTARNSKEDFYLQGSRLFYTVAERIPYPDPQLQQKLESLRQKGAYSTLESIAAVFSSFDVTVLTSEDMNFRVTEEIKIVLDRIHSSPVGNILVDDLAFSRRTAVPNPFDLKISNADNDLLHEMFVAFFVTNRLRKIIPNFQLCFGGMKAHSPQTSYLDPLATSKTCPVDTLSKVDYLLLEHLDGKTLTEMLPYASLKDYLSWFVQILLSLEMGVVHSGFTHNNLHPDNIRIVPTNSNAAKIRYFHHNDQWLLDANSIAVLTNFSMAHVKHSYDSVAQSDSKTPGLEIHETMVVNKNEHLGPIGMEEYGIHYNETRPFFDIYKLLMWSLRITQSVNRPLYEELKVLGGFFGHSTLDSLERVLNAEEPLGYAYSVEISNLERTRSLREVLAFTVANFSSELSGMLAKESQYASANILSCPRYCLLDGYSVVTLNKSTLLDGWGLREVLERLHGLKKRSKELKRLSSLTCSNLNGAENELCQSASDEAIDAQNEYSDFQNIVQKNLQQLKNSAVEEIVILQEQLDNKIRIANSDGRGFQLFVSYSTGKTDEILKQNSMKSGICRERDAIKGKIVTLVSMWSYLNLFIQEFPEVGEAPQINLSGLDPFE